MRICGHSVTVITESPKAWSTEDQQSMLLHEIIHMIADMNALPGLTDSETTVAVLANAMFAWMRDNKEAVAVMADIHIPNAASQLSPESEAKGD